MENGQVMLGDGGRDTPLREEGVRIRKRLSKPNLPAVYKTR